MKEKKPKSYCFKPGVNEAADIISFIEKQSNFNDAIRYFIEKEIAENGIRDLSNYIPAKRNIESLKTVINADAFNNVASANNAPINAIKEVSKIEDKEASISSGQSNVKNVVNTNNSDIKVNEILKNNPCYDD
jgi:hypothetical protein